MAEITEEDIDPESYGDWIAGGDDASDPAMDAEDARFLGPASNLPDPPSRLHDSFPYPEAEYSGQDSAEDYGYMTQSRESRFSGTTEHAIPAGAQVFQGSPPVQARDSAQAQAPFQGDLLMKIAGELKSIRTELVGLKGQFDDAPNGPAAQAHAASRSVEVQPPEAPAPEPSPIPAPKAETSAPQEPAPVPPPLPATPPATPPAPQTELAALSHSELKSLLRYLDRLLESLPEEKIEEFARSEYFELYRKVFDTLGLV